MVIGRGCAGPRTVREGAPGVETELSALAMKSLAGSVPPCWFGMVWLVGTLGAAPPVSVSWFTSEQLPERVCGDRAGAAMAGTPVS